MPIVFFFVIFMSYMYSLFYGVIIIKEIYAPKSQEEANDYKSLDSNESILLQIFVLNEVIVGAYIIIQFIYSTFCQGLQRYENLVELQGPEVDDAEVQRYKKEI